MDLRRVIWDRVRRGYWEEFWQDYKNASSGEVPLSTQASTGPRASRMVRGNDTLRMEATSNFWDDFAEMDEHERRDGRQRIL